MAEQNSARPDDDGPAAPMVIDTTVPHAARVWNYWLGGKDNYEVDRIAGEEFKKIYPPIEVHARAARAALGRAVRYLVAEAGIRQFLDVGTGLPTVDNTHEIAQRLVPECRVVYVDNDPLVLAHARALLTSGPHGGTRYIHADIRRPRAILDEARELLDFTRPVGLILSGILGLVPEADDPWALARELVAALPSGSHLVVFDEADTDPEATEAARRYAETGATPYFYRPVDQIIAYFDTLEPVEPGLVYATEWRPTFEVGAAHTTSFGGVARKP
jgi:hypothetical protein